MTTIRPAHAGDIPAIGAIAALNDMFPAEMAADMIAPFLNGAADHLWLVAEGETGITGFTYATAETLANRTWNMLALAVHPDKQRQGIGSTLTTELQGRLQGDARMLVIDTSSAAAFDVARRLYRKLGFEGTARIPDFWAAGDDKLTLWKSLA